MNTTANADAMTAILRQISLDWNRTISYGRSYIAIFFAYVPGFTCLMAATGSTLDSVAGAAIGGAASGFLMLNITLFSYEQMNNHHWMNGIVPINRNHQILGRFRIPYRLRSGGGIGSGRQHRLRRHHHARAS